jgi:hypothetical protein
MKVYLEEQTVAEITKRKLPTLRNDRHLGKGIPYIKLGKSVRYDPADVENYMQRHRIDPEAADKIELV